MDQLLVDLIGKPQLYPSGRIITLIAENFSLLEDHAKFLKATLAIPTEKQLPLDGINRHLFQVGPIHQGIKQQLDKANWSITQLDQQLIGVGETFAAKLNDHLPGSSSRSLIYINDASRLQLLLNDSRNWLKFLRSLHRWRTQDKHLIVLFYQQSQPTSCSTTSLQQLEYISDACVRTKSFKSCYLQSMWFRPVQLVKTLMPVKVETRYYTCKIGKSFWSADLLCFYERQQVTKGYDPDLTEAAEISEKTSYNRKENSKELDREAIETALNRVGLDDDEDENKPNESTLPYMRAQNPEQSRIFYYPDKDDDVDEEDPDYDLNI